MVSIGSLPKTVVAAGVLMAMTESGRNALSAASKTTAATGIGVIVGGVIGGMSPLLSLQKKEVDII